MGKEGPAICFPGFEADPNPLPMAESTVVVVHVIGAHAERHAGMGDCMEGSFEPPIGHSPGGLDM